MQLYKHNTSRDSTHKQAGGRSVDAALFAKELIEIYSTPTRRNQQLCSNGSIWLGAINRDRAQA